MIPTFSDDDFTTVPLPSPLSYSPISAASGSDFSDDDFVSLPSPSQPLYSPKPNHDIVHESIDLDTEYTSKQLPPLLAAVLPKGYTYIFKSLNYTQNSSTNDLAFSATIFINATSEEGATKWIQDLEGYTATTYKRKSCKRM